VSSGKVRDEAATLAERPNRILGDEVAYRGLKKRDEPATDRAHLP
jgi:hypothetical protein